MKRTLSVLLIVALLLSAFTACSVNQNITDELVSVSLRTQRNERSLTAGVDFDVSKVTTWKYTAVKADNGLSTGATGRGETNAVPLTDGKTKALSQGSWNFELFGYTSDNNLICSGEVSAVTITLDKTSVTITVRPSQTADGKGKIVISEDIRIVDENGTVYSSTTGEYTKTVTVKNSEGKEITELDEVSSGLYTVTVSFTGTAKDGTSYTAGSKTKYINVYDNLTTTVSGTVEEDSSSATMTAEGGAVKAASEPVSVTKTSEGKNEAKVDVPVKSTASSDATKETTISFPANSLKMDESATAITVTMQSSSIENVSTTYEIESDEGAAVAGFDFTLEGADSSKFETDEGVLVTTYISAGLGVWDSSNPTLKIKYIGSSSGTEPKIESYDNATGELKFRVYHFSKYCIISTDKVVAIKDGEMYDSLAAAVTAAKEDDTLIILKDLELSATQYINEGKKITIDLNGHTISAKQKTLEIQNAKVEFTGRGVIQETVNDGYAPIRVLGSGESTAENYTVITVGNDVTLKGYYGIQIIYDTAANSTTSGAHAYGVVINMYGKAVSPADESHTESEAGIYINGTINDTDGKVPEITLDGAVITARKAGIYAAGYAVWTIKDCTITAGEALSLKAGKVTIDGGTYKSNGEFYDPPTDTSNGFVATGAALSMTSNDGYAHKLDVTVKDGSFISQNGYAVYEGIPNNTKTGGKVASESYVTLDIQGGAFTGNSEKGAIKLSEIKNKYVISGGTFSSDPSEYLADGYFSKKESDDKWTVISRDEIVSGVTISGIAGHEHTLFATANDAYDTITKVLEEKGGLVQEGLSDAEFNALFTDVDESGDAKVIWTIYGEQIIDETDRPNFMSFGRKASHYSKDDVNHHFSKFEFIGGNENAKLICSKLTFPYEWWEGENHKSEVSFKNLAFESSNGNFLSFTLYQAYNKGLIASFEKCTFTNGRIGLYNDSSNVFTFTECRFDGKGESQSAIQIQGSETEVTKITITGCEFQNSRGIDIGQATAEAVIEGNTFINCGNQTEDATKNHHSAIKITSGNTFTISNNTIKNCKGTAIYVRGNNDGALGPFKGTLTITNNTISNCTYAFCDFENGEHSLYTLNTSGNIITNTETTKCSYDGAETDITEYLK